MGKWSQVRCNCRDRLGQNRLQKRLLSKQKKQNLLLVVPFLKNLPDEQRSRDLILKEQFITIPQTKELCRAAIKSGNPVEMLR